MAFPQSRAEALRTRVVNVEGNWYLELLGVYNQATLNLVRINHERNLKSYRKRGVQQEYMMVWGLGYHVLNNCEVVEVFIESIGLDDIQQRIRETIYLPH